MIQKMMAKRPEDRYEVGMAFDLDWTEGTDDLLDFLEKAQARNIGRQP